jgi:hypothetical protein
METARFLFRCFLRGIVGYLLFRWGLREMNDWLDGRHDNVLDR